jgi:hypothetical protein
VVAAQAAVGAKTNEVPVAAVVPGRLDLRGKVVTADALCGRPHNASYAGTVVMPMPPSDAVPAVAAARTAAA